MMTTLADALRRRINDYSDLERRFRDETGRELIGNPLDAPAARPVPITRSASVVIAAWNARRTIRQVVLAIEASTFARRYGSQLEVVIVDDGSTDDTWELLRDLRCDVNLLLLRHENTGQYRALNTAIDAAQGDIVVSCDDDMILTPGTLEAIMLRHQVLDDVLLIGFRYNGEPTDPRIQVESVIRELDALPLSFEHDERVTFHWPGWPENVCAETAHLKRLHGGQQMPVTDGATPDGDAWDLPRLVYGALFSLPRRDFQAIGGYDEAFVGWGFGDTLIGAKAYALGNFIVPLYDAVGLHVTHADRRADKWADADANVARLRRAQAAAWPPGAPGRRVRRVGRERLDRRRGPCSAAGGSGEPARPRETGAGERGPRLFALGRYHEAIAAFDAAPAPLRLAGQGRAYERLHEYAAARDCFDEWSRLDDEDAESAARMAMALAAQGRFDEGRRRMREAQSRRRNTAWLDYLVTHAGSAHATRGRKFLDEQLFAWAARDFAAALLHEPDNRDWAAAWDTARTAAEVRP